MKSTPFLSSKNSPVIHSTTVSNNHPHLYANTGLPAAITSTGTIQKSSSPGNISHKLFCTKNTNSSSYFAHVKIIFVFAFFFRVFS
ncbi:MAG: hypothetical protein Q8S84_04190 [bacterium]|nr:hypothetical protein [bacterium]MDP3380704.1 hypothetical protein [bacterium]